MKKGQKVFLLTFLMIFLGVLAVFLSGISDKLQTNVITVRTEKVSAPVRLALITDLHSCKYGENQVLLIDALESFAPDAVILCGDIIDEKLPEEPAWSLIRQAEERYPCFYVTGNHEYRIGDIGKVKETVRQLGAVVLEGERRTFTLNGQEIDICGMDDSLVTNATFARQLEQCSADSPENYSVLAFHRPENILKFENKGFDLVLSGHAHGGQWRIPKILENGLIAPGQGLFPRYTSGLYKISDSLTLIVSRGLAKEKTWIPRVYNNPEIVIVDIIPE